MPKPRIVASLLLLALLLVSPYFPVQGIAYAQGAKPQVTVDSQTVTPNFPDNVDFSLRAHGFAANRAELNYRLTGDPVTAEMQVNIDNPSQTISTQASLDLSTHYIPPGASVTYYWTLIGDAQAQVTTPEQTFTMTDSRYKWQTLTDSGKRVSVHWYSGSASFGKGLLSTASGALDRLQSAIQAKLSRQANIYIYADQNDLYGALAKNIPEWAAGKAFPDLALILASISDDSEGQSETHRIIPHELSHLLMYSATRNPYNTPPAWMDEGLAVHNQEVQDPSEEEAVRQAARDGSLIPLTSLSGSFGADEEVARLSYGESRSVMDFMLSSDRFGPQKFARTVAAFREGVTYDDALRAGLGVTTAELDREWRASLPYPVNEPASTAPQRGPAPRVANPWTAMWPDLAVFAGIGMCLVAFLGCGVLVFMVLIRRRAT